MSTSLARVNINSKQVQEDDLIILPNVDNSELIEQFKLKLVGQVRGMDLGNHRFQFDFELEADLMKVLNKRPCHFNKWTFSLERWMPHIGDSFPNTMTFWISIIGIPTHYWLDPIFDSLGSQIGKVGLIEAKTAKFVLRAQISSGEIVPMKLVYHNLYRYYKHCRLISHEIDGCPLLSDREKKDKLLALEAERDKDPSFRNETHKGGEPSSRPTPLSTKDRRFPEDTLDSRMVTRNDHRLDHPPSDHGNHSCTTETYHKRRYDESFHLSKQREVSRRTREKEVLAKMTFTLAIPKETTRPSLPSGSTGSLRLVSDQPPRLARQLTSSLDHVRERPFRLNLQKSAPADQKLKGKVSEIDDLSEEASSAKKSISFEALPHDPSFNQVQFVQIDPLSDAIPKIWNEMTLEEDEHDLKEVYIP
ncbi:hypothetical protein N665_0040s0044 [Sinapis alba]|nr:hypothetical protein N665_0040s0044 [Sinapis alba]